MGLPNLNPVEQTTEGVLIRVRVQPRAPRNEVTGRYGNAVRIRLSAAPVNGSANEALIRFLATRLDVPRSAVRLMSGQNSRSKIISIIGADMEQVRLGLGI
jgi:uncharacterized protein (TIGR00251 family)